MNLVKLIQCCICRIFFYRLDQTQRSLTQDKHIASNDLEFVHKSRDLLIEFLSFMPLVVSHYSVLSLEVTTAKKCHQFVRCLLKNAIRYLKNAIVPLDVCSKMPLDIIIFTSNPLTMLYDKNKPRTTWQFFLSHNDKCGPNCQE